MKYIEIYCDECRQDLLVNRDIISATNRYLILGGIWINSDFKEEYKNEIKLLREKYSVYGEIKWNRVCENKLEFYKELIKLFFEKNSEDISFRAIVIDASKVDIKKYHNNSQELGFYKFYYQLLQHWIEKENKYNILLDYRKDKSKRRAYELKSVINNYLKKDAVTNVQFINSKESLLLQIEDVLMGAVGYKFNMNGEGRSEPKMEIVKLIEAYHSIEETDRTEPKFNIFKIKFKGGR